MIYDYKIENNVLFLYLDFNQEFAKNKDKKINEYIKQNKINFKGTTIALVVSGAIIATINLKSPITNIDNPINELNYSIALVNNDYDINEVNNSNDIVEENISEITYNTEKEVSNNTNASTSTNKEKITTSNVITNKSSNSTSNDTIEEVIDNNTYVTIKRSNGAYQKLELEEYIIGVVAAEMPASFNSEALKAQAILSRTYALKAINTNKQLTDNSSTQNYKSNEELKTIWGNSYTTYYQKIKDAVISTKGMYLTYKGEIIEAVYHSTSNGKTESAEFVWGNSYPYLISVDSPYDSTNKGFLTIIFMTYDEVSNKLGINVNNNSEIKILSKTSGNRILEISIDGYVYRGVFIRNTLNLRSADFDAELTDTGIKFSTRGYGHGVGMSQYGANGMANNGANYQDILTHYYSNITISKLS